MSDNKLETLSLDDITEVQAPDEPTIENPDLSALKLEDIQVNPNQPLNLELDLDQPVDFAEQANKDLVGMGESAVRGGLQGATFNLSDELAAAVESGAMSGERYQAIRDEVRAANTKAQEENPLSYGTGNVLGAGAQIAATSGLSNVAKGLSSSYPVLSKLGQLAPKALINPATTAAESVLAPSLLKGVPGALTKTIAGTADVIPQAALYRAGASEADIGSDQFKQDVMASISPSQLAFPALLSAGVNAVGPAIGAIPGFKRGYAQTLETGLIPGGAADVKEIQQQVATTSKKISDKLTDSLVKKYEPMFKKQINESSKKLVGSAEAAQSLAGKDIELIRESLKSSKEPFEIATKVQQWKQQVSNELANGAYTEQEAKGLLKVLEDLSSDAQAADNSLKLVTTQTLKQGAEVPSSTTVKLKGKNLSAEDLAQLDAQGYQRAAESGSVSVKEKPSLLDALLPKKTITKSTTESLSLPESIKETASAEELLKMRKTLGDIAGYKNEIVSRRAALLKKEVDALLDERLSTQEATHFEQQRKRYGTAKDFLEANSDKGALTSSLVNKVESIGNTPSTAATNEVESMFKNLSDISSPELAAKIRAEAAPAAQGLRDVQQAQSQYLQSVPGEAPGSQLFPNINKSLVSTNAKDLASTGEALKLKGTINKYVPAAEAKALTKEIDKINQRAELGKVELLDPRSLNLQSGSLIKKLPITAGGIAGKVAKTVEQSSETSRAAVNKLVNALPEQWQGLADRAANAGYNGLSNVLKGSMGKDNLARSATLFMISQDPSLKKQLNDLNEQESE